MKQIACIAILALGQAMTAAAAPLGTAITYQGMLDFQSEAAQGSFDFRFRLYDQAANGARVGPVVRVDDVVVDGGLFAVSLDFGLEPYAGDALWLAVDVRPGADTGAYQPLNPRQPLAPVPYALHAEFVAAGSVGALEVNPDEVQVRIAGSCADGEVMRSVRVDGSIECAPDDIGPETITGDDITDGSITGSDLAANAVGAAQVKAGEVQLRIGTSCAAGTFLSAINSDGSAVCMAESAAGPVGSSDIIDGSIDTVDLRDGAVTTRILAKNSIGTAQMDTEAIGTEQLMDGAVSTDKLGKDSVTTHQIADGAVGSGDIGLQAVQSVHVDDNAITGDHIFDGTIGTLDLAPNAVTSSQIANGAVTADKVNEQQIQLRVSQTCEDGMYLKGMAQSGAAICESLPGTVYSELGNGRPQSVALKPGSGFPLISLETQQSGRLELVSCQDIHCKASTRRTFAAFDTNFGSSIGIRPDGRPIISYVRRGGLAGLKVYDCAVAGCSSGTTITLETSENLGGITSLAVLPSGNPVIAYRDVAREVLRLYRCSTSSCSSGSALDITPIDTVIGGIKVIIRSNGLPLIGFTDHSLSEDRLRIYDCDNAQCTSGSFATVDTAPRIGGIDLAIGARGNPVLVYGEGSDRFEVPESVRLFECSSNSCVDGSFNLLASGIRSPRPVVIKDASDNLVIAFQDDNRQSVNLYRCYDFLCSIGGYARVDIGYGARMVAKPNGHPLIVYVRGFDEMSVASCDDDYCLR